jgi:hypothetical protein
VCCIGETESACSPWYTCVCDGGGGCVGMRGYALCGFSRNGPLLDLLISHLSPVPHTCICTPSPLSAPSAPLPSPYSLNPHPSHPLTPLSPHLIPPLTPLTPLTPPHSPHPIPPQMHDALLHPPTHPPPHYLALVTAANQLASLCWRSAHGYALYKAHSDDDDDEDPLPIVEPSEAEALCRRSMRLLQPQYDADSDPVYKPVVECLSTLRRVRTC